MEQNTVYMLGRGIRLRREPKKCVIYQIDDFFHSVDHVTILMSKEAVLLTLFSGELTFGEIADKYFFILRLPEESPYEKVRIVDMIVRNIAKRMAFDSVDDLLSPLTDPEEVRPTYNPFDFIINVEEEEFDVNDLRLSAPLSVNFNVSTRCSFNCVYCYHPLVPVDDYMPIDRFEALVSDLKKSGTESIMLTGGDPLNRPDFLDVVRVLHKHDLFYSISTKSILSDQTIEALCDECGLDRIQLSLDSHDPVIVARLLGCSPSYLGRFEAMVKRLQARSVDVRIKAVLTSQNIDGLEDFLRYVYHNLNVRHVQIVSYGRSGTRHQDCLFPDAGQFEKATDVMNNFKRKHQDCDVQGGGFETAYDEPLSETNDSITDFFEKRGICNAGRFSLTLMPNGKVFICEQLPYDEKFVLGDLSKDSLYEVWNGKTIKEWLSPPRRSLFPEDSPCKICAEDTYKTCHTVYSRCLRFIWEVYGNTDYADIKCPSAVFEKRRVL